jgi:hypothetical protein
MKGDYFCFILRGLLECLVGWHCSRHQLTQKFRPTPPGNGLRARKRPIDLYHLSEWRLSF